MIDDDAALCETIFYLGNDNVTIFNGLIMHISTLISSILVVGDY